MSRVLVVDEWYDELATDALLEKEYQALIVQGAELFWPAYRVVPFTITLRSEYFESAKADLALIDRNYVDWVVVEVELGHHSFDAHVLPQARTLREARYDGAVAEYLLGRCSDLDPMKTRELVRASQPQVLVVVNQPMAFWRDPLRQCGVRLSVVQVFRSDRNKHLFRVDGDTLLRPSGIASGCSPVPSMPGFLQVLNPAILNVPNHGRLNITCEGRVGTWERLDTADRVFLMPYRGAGVPPARTYVLRPLDDGSFALESTDSRRRTP